MRDVRGFTMRKIAAAAAFALGFGLASHAHAQAAEAEAAPEAAASVPDAAAPVAEPAAEEEADVADTGDELDPWEGFNRSVYGFNDAIDRAVVEPTAKGYRAITPGFFRSGVRNFIHNLKSPVIFFNDVLQAEPERAAETLGRFALNTTVGVGGLFDVGKSAGVEGHDEDFGQTLAVWGFSSGPYLMLPLLGPSTVRDATGRVVDIAIDPITYADFRHDDTARAVRFGADLLTQRTDAIEAIESIRETSLDPYVSTRSAYFQARASAIRNGEEADDEQDAAEDSSDSE
jgi:phospholipid-binding lipoprotein MlaA